jgi:regulator of sigma E protease
MQSPGLILYIVGFALLLGPLVFFHELGHYLAARLFGIKSEVFSIGFGPEIAGWTDKQGTRWKLSWIPLGGYVRFAGDMNPASQPDPAWLALPPAERARTFQAKPLWQRATVVLAGPATNFFLALLILMGFALAYGDNRTPTTVAGVETGSAAAAAGLKAGDKITALGGRAVETFEDLAYYVQLRAGERVRIDFDRNGIAMANDAVIGKRHVKDKFGNEGDIGMLGVRAAQPAFVRVGVLEAPGVASRELWALVRQTGQGLGQLITGRRPIKDMSGVVGMVKFSGEQLSMGWPDFIWLVAIISINLGFINLLPVPMLDGGHLLFYAIEAVRRRPVTPAIQEWAFRGGLAAILCLFLVVTFNDLGKVGLWQHLAGLIG